MSETNIITSEQAQEMRKALAAYEQNEAYKIALKRHELFALLQPIVDSDDFISIHEQVSELRNNGPKDDMFFGIGLEAIYNGMTNLGIQVANWTTPVDPSAPVTELASSDTPLPPYPSDASNGETVS